MSQPAGIGPELNRLQITLDSTGLGTFDFDHHTKTLLCSSVTRNHFGLGPDTALTMELLLAAIHLEDRERVRRAVVSPRAAASGVADSLEFRTLRAGTPQAWVALRGHVFLDSAGLPARYVGITSDITERITAEASLRSAFADRERLAAIVASSEDAVVGKSIAGIIESWNTGAEKLYGYSAAEVLGRSMLMLLPPDRVSEEREILLRIQQGEQVHHFETVRLQKDGSSVRVSLTISPIRDGDGRIVGASHTARDITARAAAEQSKAQLAAIVNSSEDAIVGKTLDGVVLSWNAGAERVYGYTEAEMKWRPMSVLVPQDRAGEEADILARLRRGERMEHFESVRIRKDGRRIPVSLTISPIRNSAGEIVGASHVARDISEAKGAEEKLRLSQKMEAVGRLAGGIAHDFNNLLTIIAGNLSLLGDSPNLDGEDRGLLGQVAEAAERAAGLTRQLLAFSRKQVVQPRPLDLNKVVSGFKDMIQRLIGENIRVESYPAPDLWRTLADPGQIEQIIMNLAVNARDAMPEGGRIVIQTENWTLSGDAEQSQFGFSPGRYVRLLFSDTGHGMDPATRARIFEPFFTTKEPGKGTGLGLSTVFGIVQQSGGHISVYSEQGRGTTFTIYFPRTDEVESRPLPPASVQTATGGETILLVEDESGLRKLASKVLSSKGYRVLEASQVEEAVSIIESHREPINLILTDIVMPGASGTYLAALLGTRYEGIKIIFMSGYGEHVIVDKILAEPGAAFIQKPFMPAELLRKIREVLDA
jgi:two-component system cell cycle sensor histidine kinase/response regulator CckA